MKIKVAIIVFLFMILLIITMFIVKSCDNKAETIKIQNPETTTVKRSATVKTESKKLESKSKRIDESKEIVVSEDKDHNFDESKTKINAPYASYYYQPNWLTEEIVVSEEKEKLTFFEKIDGKVAKVNRTTKIIHKWLTNINDEDSYVKNSFVLVSIATGSDIAYKYYFDKNGYLITDNLSRDYTVLDNLGREIDAELKPVEYYIGSKDYSIEHIEKVVDSKEDVYYGNRNRSINSTPSQIIITEGVVFRNKLEKIFNTLIDRDMTKYIAGGSGYQSNTKGKIYTKTLWKNALKIRGNGSYIVFENHVNNFNKITGKIATEYTNGSNNGTSCRLIVYDKVEYDKGNLDEYLYYNDEFNYTEQKTISFTFDRSIKNIVFVLYVDGKYKNRSVYFKDLRFGFSKSAYRGELIRKAEDKAEIDYLKSLGLYVEDDSYFDIIDEDGEIIDEIDEELEDIEDFFDSNKYYDELMDRKSGPAFDEELKKLSERRVGPYYDIVGTRSEIKEKQRKSKIIHIE